MQNKGIVMLDIASLSREVLSYIIAYVNPYRREMDNNAYIKDLEKLLYEDFLATIECNTNTCIRDHFFLSKSDPVEWFTEIYKDIDQLTLTDTLEDLYSVQHFHSIICDCMGRDTFNVWSLKKTKTGIYRLENFGDFRINMWEEEHIRNGKFVP